MKTQTIKRLINKPFLCWQLVIFIVGLIPFLSSCSSKVASDIPPELLKPQKTPTLEATNFETYITDSGVVRYSLITPKLLVFNQDGDQEPYKEFPDGFHTKRFDQNRKVIAELSANWGKNLEKQNKWIARGNVVAVNDQGDTLRTEELTYLEKEDRIFTDKFVSLKKGDQLVNGNQGFESNSQLTRYTFKKTTGHTYISEP